MRAIISLLLLNGCVTACTSDPNSVATFGDSAGTSMGGTAPARAGSAGSTSAGTTSGGNTAPNAGTAGQAGNANSPTSMLSLKQPIERDGKLVLEFGDTYFAVDPSHGARITSLRVAGHELLKLTGAPNFADAFGSTFWPSPQSWPWPPPAELDVMDYAVRIEPAGVLVLTSQSHSGTGLQVEKRFSADLARAALRLEYAMTNTGSDPVSWAPWEITRMPAEGLAFWPTGGTPFGENPMLTDAALGHTWCDPSRTEGEAKLFADGSGGYLAYATAGSILIKQFVDQSASVAAPGEAEVELYVNADHSYLEVENQGAYAAIAPGQTVRWQVAWYVRRLPPGVTPSAGNADLVAFVSETLH